MNEPIPLHAGETIEFRPVKSLIPYARNPRTHSKEQVAQLVASLRRFRWTNPILVDEQDGIVAGHGRAIAAHECYRKGETIHTVGGATLPDGMVPVIVARGWSDDEKRAYVIADNKLALNAGWDLDLLKIELGELGDMGFDLGLIGFTADEIGLVFDPLGAAGQGQSIGSLAERFLVAPFSVLNAREGWWQDRKRGWIALGIQSELGRGENALGFSDTILEPDPEKRAAAARRADTLGPMRQQYTGQGGNLPRPPATRGHAPAPGVENKDLRGAALALRTTTDPYRKGQPASPAIGGEE